MLIENRIERYLDATMETTSRLAILTEYMDMSERKNNSNQFLVMIERKIKDEDNKENAEALQIIRRIINKKRAEKDPYVLLFLNSLEGMTLAAYLTKDYHTKQRILSRVKSLFSVK